MKNPCLSYVFSCGYAKIWLLDLSQRAWNFWSLRAHSRDWIVFRRHQMRPIKQQTPAFRFQPLVHPTSCNHTHWPISAIFDLHWAPKLLHCRIDSSWHYVHIASQRLASFQIHQWPLATDQFPLVQYPRQQTACKSKRRPSPNAAWSLPGLKAPAHRVQATTFRF